jgi:mitochondrial enoyl-[acyl-carrier protein] reductase / trans-2-enoyl-CoA reductase
VKSLADGGTCVTFGGMVGDPVRFPTRFLIFNDVRLCGFWMDRWVRTRPREDFLSLMKRVFELVETGAIKTPIQEQFPLESYQEAIEAATAPRMGKILFQGTRQVAPLNP